MSGGDEAIEVGGVRLTHPDRVLYAGQGLTKRGLAEYYRALSDWMLPHLKGRPATLMRCPRGEGGECFVQRRANGRLPSFVRRVRVKDADGAPASYISVDNLPSLIYMAQIGVLEVHTWGARRDRLDRPDRVILDLDPGEGVRWEAVVDAAQEARRRLREAGLVSFVKTTGGKGLHVVAPLARRHTWDRVREFARALAERMEADAPERFVASSAREERSGRIYVDYLRNAWSASAVAGLSPRAKPGAPVSMPLTWDELAAGARPEDFTVRSAAGHLERLGGDPWAGYADARRQSLTRAALAKFDL